jgi:xanthine dehydrogenase molybdopterin-binding subunit B
MLRLGSESVKLFIWDNAILVVAENIDRAREAAYERLVNFENLRRIVEIESPLQSELPCVRILFTENSIYTVNSAASLEKTLANA